MTEKKQGPGAAGRFIERWSKTIVAALGTLTAVMTLAATVLGVVNVRTNQEKDQAEARGTELSEQVSSLTEELVVLESERDSRLQEIAELETQRDELSQTVTELTGNGEIDPTPDRAYLSDLDWVADQSFSAGSNQISGDVYLNSVYGQQGYCSGERMAYAEYDLGRRFQQLTATIGLSDRNHTFNRTVRFEVFLDNEVVLEEAITGGEAMEIEVPVSDKLRMRLEVTFFRPENCDNDSYYDEAVWGNATLSP